MTARGGWLGWLGPRRASMPSAGAEGAGRALLAEVEVEGAMPNMSPSCVGRDTERAERPGEGGVETE